MITMLVLIQLNNKIAQIRKFGNNKDLKTVRI